MKIGTRLTKRSWELIPDEMKHTERNDLLFAEKMMLVDEPV